MMLGFGPIGSAPIGAMPEELEAAEDVVATAAVIVKMTGERVHVSEHVPAPAQPVPPVAAERLLRWVLPLKEQAPLLGDLAEMYADTRSKFGMREARRLYWSHSIRSIPPVLQRAAMRWSAVAAFAELIRRTFGS